MGYVPPPPRAPAPSPASPAKNAWDKLDIILKPVGGLLTALAVAGVGYFTTELLRSQQEAQTNARLYAELMSGREQSDSLLRQEMFKTIITDLLAATKSPGGGKTDFAQEVLRLEILAYNFHDALDLAPIFKDLGERLSDPANGMSGEQRERLTNRLERVAREVIAKQVAVLEEKGSLIRRDVPFDRIEADGFIQELISDTLWLHDEHAGPDGGSRKAKFQVDIVNVDRAKREVRLRLSVWPGEAVDAFGVTFTLGFFDFPMIDNTRVLEGARCAIVLENFSENAAGIALVFFPSSRASLKEKPYYEEIIDSLRPMQRR